MWWCLGFVFLFCVFLGMTLIWGLRNRPRHFLNRLPRWFIVTVLFLIIMGVLNLPFELTGSEPSPILTAAISAAMTGLLIILQRKSL